MVASERLQALGEAAIIGQFEEFITQALALGHGLTPVAPATGRIAQVALEVVAVRQLAVGQAGQVFA